ncbi:unnamed protein product, partial [Cuscuta campestris]
MVKNMDHGLPMFYVLGYDDWKIMMEAHLYALHDCMWMVLEDGPLKIQMENPERNPTNPEVVQYIPKPKEKWDDRDCKKHNLDNVAKAAIFKTLDPITFSKIKHLKTAMEIWQEKNVRLLRSLPAEWYIKATAMEEGRNLENYTIQGLLDELRTYEHELKKKKEEQVTPFPTALMTNPRVLASEGTCPRSSDTPSSSQPPRSKTENYEVEFAMMVKQFRKFKKKPGHWKLACLYQKVENYGERERNEKKKKKAMVAAESEESSSSSSDEEALVCMERRAEKSNREDWWTMSEDDTLCLMAKDDADQEVTSQTSYSSSYESIPTSENLFDKFKKMMEDFEEINLKHSSLTEENKLLSEENLKLTKGRKSQLSEIINSRLRMSLFLKRDCKKHNLDNVAKAAIFKTLDPITFSKIKHLKTAMEIWQGLGKLCEGLEDLRKQKIEVLLEKFKGFKMLPGESFDMLDERFHKILNDLASLNHVLSPKEKNVRLLRSLPTEWYTKATAMEEGRNLENYTVQGLLDELRTYEHE